MKSVIAALVLLTSTAQAFMVSSGSIRPASKLYNLVSQWLWRGLLIQAWFELC
jgi:hypothetical protein